MQNRNLDHFTLINLLSVTNVTYSNGNPPCFLHPSMKQLGYLEKMHPGDGPYFNNQAEKRVAGKFYFFLKKLVLFRSQC